MTSDLLLLGSVQGAASILATLLLVWHIWNSWDSFTYPGQKMRYITLLWFAMTVAFDAVDRVQHETPFRLSGTLLFIGAILLTITTILSIRESRRAKNAKNARDRRRINPEAL